MSKPLYCCWQDCLISYIEKVGYEFDNEEQLLKAYNDDVGTTNSGMYYIDWEDE